MTTPEPLHEMCKSGSLQFGESLRDYILYLKLQKNILAFLQEHMMDDD